MSKDDKKEAMFAKLASQARPAAAVEEPAPTRAADPSPAPPSSKRANPLYCQSNAYITKATRKAVNKLLLDHEEIDYSDLIESLLVKWLAENS